MSNIYIYIYIYTYVYSCIIIHTFLSSNLLEKGVNVVVKCICYDIRHVLECYL